jgi:hypothetical protein
VLSVFADCSPAALRSALAGHEGALARREGALLGVFDSIGAALDAAALAQRRAGAGRAPRIGISHGDVAHAEDMVEGRAADEAYALAEHAERGQVLASEVVRVLADGGHALVRAVPAGDADAIGPAWQLVWGDSAGVPLPVALEPDGPQWGFVGRDRELARLREALAAARAGERRVVLLAGEAGIGKTRLAAEAAAAAHAGGAVVLYGRADEGLGIPYQPIAEALGQLVPHLTDETLAAAGGEVAELARLVPALAERLEKGAAASSGGQPYLLFSATGALFAAVSTRAPVVLVLDDLHWADPPTLVLLRHLLVAPGSLALLVIATYRPGDLAQNGELASAEAALRRDGRVSRLDLVGLADSDVLAVVEAASGGELEEGARAFASALQRDTDGNPLFVTEVLRSLGDEVDIRRAADSAGPAELPVPGTLRDLLAARVAGIGADAREALEAAAVSGREFDLEVLREVVGAGDAQLVAALDAAEGASLVSPVPGTPGRFAFAHPLIATTLYEQQGAAKRGLLHRQVAEALERLAGDRPEERAPELARHWNEAAPADRERALRYAQLAGERALQQHEPGAAARWYGRAIELRGGLGRSEDRDHCELLIGLGIARRQQGDAGFRETLLAAARLARRLGETELLVRAALANTRGFVSASGEVDDERVALLTAALDALGERDSPERAKVLATLAAELSFDPDPERRAQLSDEAVATARRAGDAGTLCRVLSARFVPIWRPETLEERLEITAESARLADELGDPLAQFSSLHWHGVALVEAARMDEARRAVDREGALAARLGEPTTRWLATYDRANLAIIAGRLEEAERLAGDALAIAMETGQPDAGPFYASQLTNIRYEQGRLAELQPMIAETVAGNPGIPAFRGLLALACLEGDLDAEAAELLAAEPIERLPRDLTWLAANVLWAHVCAGVGDEQQAALLYERLAPHAGQIVYTGISIWGDVDHALGKLAATLGRPDDAERHFVDSGERYAECGAPLWLAHAALDEAALRLARGAGGDRRRARELVEIALQESHRLGATNLERRATVLRERERAVDVLATAGTPAPPPPRPREPAAAGSERTAALLHEGEMWTLRSPAGTFHLKDAKGLAYLARLLADPHQEVHVMELQAAPMGASAAPAEVSELALAADDAGAVLDPEAKEAYRQRLEDLDEAIAEAERFGDPERAAGAREEREAIAHELAAALGLGGRDRRAASTAEKARVNATRAIRKAIGRIEECDSALGQHLDRAVRTGTYCAYDPSPQDEVSWELSR